MRCLFRQDFFIRLLFKNLKMKLNTLHQYSTYYAGIAAPSVLSMSIAMAKLWVRMCTCCGRSICQN